MKSTYNQLHGVWIKKHRAEYRGGDAELLYHNKGIAFHNFIRREWYFRYIAAKFQVENPRNFIELHFYNYECQEPKGFAIKRLKDKIKGKRRALTIDENNLQKAIDNWESLFPIQENDLYLKAVDKIEARRCEIALLEKELSTLITP